MNRLQPRAISQIVFIAAFFLSQAGVLSAEKADEPSYQVTLQFASNYVDRGEDMFADYARQKGKSYGSASGAPVFQPSILFQTPLEGIYFQLDGSFAMTGRDDRDSDRTLQYGPDAPSLLGGWDDATRPVLSLQGGFDRESLESRLNENSERFASFWNGDVDLSDYYGEEFGSTYGIPGFYKEKNGLKRKDKLIATVGWGGHSRIGDVAFGISVDSLVNERGKETPTNELFFTLAPAFYSDLSFEAYIDMGNSDNYFQMGWGHAVDLTKNLSVTLDLSAGYSVIENLKGWRDYTGRLGLNAGHFSFGINGSIRPTPAFFDEDDPGEDSIPSSMNGGSSSRDGLVVDPGRTGGLASRLVVNSVNRAIAEKGFANYTWTPRQKLPRELVWVDASYTFTF